MKVDGGYTDTAIRALTGAPTFTYNTSAITDMTATF